MVMMSSSLMPLASRVPMCWPSRITQIVSPTASLTEQETATLLAIVRDLQNHDIACIYISHKRLGDLHQLLLTEAEVADAGVGRNGQIDLRQQLPPP
jgi:hypothetical protein